MTRSSPRRSAPSAPRIPGALEPEDQLEWERRAARPAGIVTLDDLAVRTGDLEIAKQITSKVARAALPDYFFHQRGG